MNDFLQSLRNGQAEKQRTPKTRKNYDNSYHNNSSSRFNSYGGGYQPNSRPGYMKRQPAHPHMAGNQPPAIDDSTVTSILAEAIESLSAHIETLTKNQEFLINAQERTADMLERQAVAIERIVSHLNMNITYAPQDDVIKKEEADPQQFENHYVSSRDAAIDTEEMMPQEDVKASRSVLRKRKKVAAATSPMQENQNTESQNAELMSRDEIMGIIYSMRDQGATFDQVASYLTQLGQPTFSGRGEWHAQTIHRLCNKK